MKLNLTREQVSLPIYNVTPCYAKRIQEDWLALEAQVEDMQSRLKELYAEFVTSYVRDIFIAHFPEVLK